MTEENFPIIPNTESADLGMETVALETNRPGPSVPVPTEWIEQQAEDSRVLAEPGSIMTEISQMHPTAAEMIGLINFGLVGITDTSEDALPVFRTDTAHDDIHGFFVYYSVSGGGLRVSQGRNKGEGTMKGSFPKDNPKHQYTQDNRLHPDFEAAYFRLLQTNVENTNTLPADFVKISPAQAAVASHEFAIVTETQDLPNESLAANLARMHSGWLSNADIIKTFAVSEVAAVGEVLMTHVTEMNRLLEDADAVPDFTQPAASKTYADPNLGVVERRVYKHSMGGKTYEWHMANDSEGHVWIDRLRLADAEVSVYGTDKQNVYSGILTSKPFDYIQQVEAIPDRFKRYSNDGYADTGSFLDNFLPIQRYRQATDIMRTNV